MNKVKTLLLIEDESPFWLKFRITMSRLSFDVDAQRCETTMQGLELYKSLLKDGKKPDCLMVDYRLMTSDMNGVDFIKVINKELGNNIILGIISTSSGSELYETFGKDPEFAGMTELEAAMQAGANFWLCKLDTPTEKMQDRIEKLHEDFYLAKEHGEFKVYL